MSSSQSAWWDVPADHPAFAGHFPGRPIVPGVVLLDKLVQFIGKSTAGTTISSAKFLSAVAPGETLNFKWHNMPNGGIQFEISGSGRMVARGALTISTES